METSLYRQVVELRRPIQASLETHAQRTRLFLRVDHDGVDGVGEISPQPSALNGDPGLDEVLGALRDALVRLEELSEREGEVPHWSRAARLGSGAPRDNAAYALIEMALFDRELRRDEVLVEDVWSPAHHTPWQQTVSILDEQDWSLDERVERVRVKCAPGPLSASAQERLRELRVPVLLDFNCSATCDDDVLELTRAVARCASLDAVEQPYPVGNLVDHARLAARLDVALSLDEGVRSLRDLAQIVNYGAASMLCVKPARVGGLANARTLITRAQGRGLRVYLGGFFESAYARRVHRALAASCVIEPSDLAEVQVANDIDLVLTPTSFGLEPALVSRGELEPVSLL
ncbi:MAG TPA: enolase C-terminal domain-like protein [Acidimicrobiales bacterium]|nr:enolase C-terminal domain-like protein [Acidimicrobiales bacterium]